MAKKKRSAAPARVKVKRAVVKEPGSQKVARKKRPSAKAVVAKTELIPMKANAATLIPTSKRDSLLAWLSLYMEIEGRAGSDNTIAAKKIDLTKFLSYFQQTTHSDLPDGWTRSVTQGFLKQLEKIEAPSTINRRLATLKHAAKWVHRQRPFLAGTPTVGITELVQDDPEWKGLTELEVTRLRSAAEQLVHLQRRKNQQPLRTYALFVVLLYSGLRISELLRLQLEQYKGKHLVNVRRKGRVVTRQKFLPKDAREALDEYIANERGRESGALFCTRTGQPMARENAHYFLDAIASQANANLPDEKKISFSAHDLRHTYLRKLANKYGVQYAKEESGQVSDKYIWRYVQPSQAEREEKLEQLY